MDEFIEASPQSSPVHFVSSNGMGIQFMPSDGASSGYYVSRYSRNLQKQQKETCSFVGNHEEVQHQHKPYSSHQKPL